MSGKKFTESANGKAQLDESLTLRLSTVFDGAELAELFWCMGSEQQALFFNRIGTFRALVMQLQAITDDEALSMKGRHAMQRIGEYAAKEVD